MAFLLRIKELIFDFLFPRSPKLLALETLPPGKLLEILPRSALDESGVVALFDYQDALVKELIWEIKYKGNRVLAEKLGFVLYDTIIDELSERNVFVKEKSVVLIPMPVSDKRRLERGWNQAELLAGAVKSLDTLGQFKYLPRQLVKIRHTESQTRTATKRERLENLDNSMLVLNPASVAGRFVVLVDDVTTTGATFREAKRALNLAGAKKVLCVAVSH